MTKPQRFTETFEAVPALAGWRRGERREAGRAAGLGRHHRGGPDGSGDARARARAQDVRVNGQPTVPALLARMLGAADAEDEAAAGVGAEWGGTAVGALRALADLLL